MREFGNAGGNPFGLSRNKSVGDLSSASSVGSIIYSLGNPGAKYLPADGTVVSQSTYPDLLGSVGLYGGSYDFTNLAEVTSLVTLGTAPSCIATDHKGGWLIGSNTGLLRRSTNDGVAWGVITSPTTGNINDVATDCKGVWVIATSTGIYRTADNGDSWALMSAAAPQAITTDRKGVWVAGVGTNVTISRDNGLTWAASKAVGVSAASICTDNNGGWYITDSSSGFKTTGAMSYDNALTWGTFTHTSMQTPRVAAAEGGAVVISGYGPTFAISSDGAKTWSATAVNYPLSPYVISIDKYGSVLVIGGNSSPATYIAANSTNFGKAFTTLTWSGASPGTVTRAATSDTGVWVFSFDAPKIFVAAKSYPYNTLTQVKLPTVDHQNGKRAYIRVLK